MVEDPFETNDLAVTEKDILSRMINEMSLQLNEEGALYPEDASGTVLNALFLSHFTV